MCYKKTRAKLGKLFDNGPSIIVVCEPCQQIPDTIYSVISTRAISTFMDTPIKWLGKGVKWKMRKINEHLWLKEHLFDTVSRLYADEIIRTSLETKGETEVEEKDQEEVTVEAARKAASAMLKGAMELYSRMEAGREIFEGIFEFNFI